MNETRNAEVFETEDGKQVAVEPFSVKEFVGKHKWKIAGGVLAIGGLIFAKKKFGKKSNIDVDDFLPDFISDFNKTKNLSVPDNFKTAWIDELWVEDDEVLGIMHDVYFDDLGNFGKELKDKIPELKDKDFVHFPCIGFTKYNNDGPLFPVTTVVEDNLEKTLGTISKIEKAKKEA